MEKVILILMVLFAGCGQICEMADTIFYGKQNNPRNYKGWVVRRVLLEHVGFDGYSISGYNLEIQMTKGTMESVHGTDPIRQWDAWYAAKERASIIRPIGELKIWHEGDTIK